jgi:hypothetical protein
MILTLILRSSLSFIDGLILELCFGLFFGLLGLFFTKFWLGEGFFSGVSP